MPRFRPKGVLERTAAADLWKHTLSKIPTVFGRLVYLGTLRDPNSGAYRHHGLSAAFGREESGRALKQSHEELFQSWLEQPLAERAEDLKLYLLSLDDSPASVVEEWLRSGVYRTHAPTDASEAQKRHFSKDLKALLEVFRNEFAAGPRTQNSSPPE
jgi:hypothetical protein